MMQINSKRRATHHAWNSFIRLVGIFALILTSGVLTLFFAEGVIRLWHLMLPLPHTLVQQKLENEIPALSGAFYFNPQFLDDHLADYYWFTPKGTRIVLPGNVKRRFINTIDNHRVTSFSPKTFAHRVFMFGGSTVFDYEVPDPMTISSFLQYLINHQSKSKLKVENFGSPGMMVYQQNQALTRILGQIRPQDIVIYYDGVNDIIQSLYFNNPSGISANQTEYLKSLGIAKTILNWQPWLENSDIVATMELVGNSHPPSHLLNSQVMAQINEQFARTQVEELNKAKKLVEERGGRFFHFNQPFLTTKHPRSQTEESILENRFVTPAGLAKCLIEGEQLRISTLQSMKTTGLPTFDLSSSFNSIHNNFFIDYMHVNYLGNLQIARDLFSAIFLPNSHSVFENIDATKVWHDYLAQNDEDSRLIREQVIPSDSIEWKSALPLIKRGSRRWVSKKNYLFLSQSIRKSDARAIVFEWNFHLSRKQAQTINDLVWYQGTKEIKREVVTYKNWLSLDYKVRTPLFSIPKNADRMLSILTAWDSDLAIGNSVVRWLR